MTEHNPTRIESNIFQFSSASKINSIHKSTNGCIQKKHLHALYSNVSTKTKIWSLPKTQTKNSQCLHRVPISLSFLAFLTQKTPILPASNLYRHSGEHLEKPKVDTPEILINFFPLSESTNGKTLSMWDFQHLHITKCRMKKRWHHNYMRIQDISSRHWTNT